MTWDDSRYVGPASAASPSVAEEDDRPFATRVRYVNRAGAQREKLVVVYASTADEAAIESGLGTVDFHEATEAELDEWSQKIAEPLTASDCDYIIGVVRKMMREQGRRRRKMRAEGRHLHGKDKMIAVHASVLRGKLEEIAAERDESIPEVG